MNEEGKLVKEESNKLCRRKEKKTSCTGFFEKKV